MVAAPPLHNVIVLFVLLMTDSSYGRYKISHGGMYMGKSMIRFPIEILQRTVCPTYKEFLDQVKSKYSNPLKEK